MSSSKPEKKWEGTIFMGPQESRESSVEKMYAASSTHGVWNKQTEEEYMARVKEKAVAKVKNILQKAESTSKDIIHEAQSQAQSIIAEAEKIKEEAKRIREEAESIRNDGENIRERAQGEGYNTGIHQANDMFAQARTDMAQATAVILLAIHQQCITIFDSWRKDLSELLLEAVEVGTGFVIDNDRVALLQNLLEKSTKALLDKREYHICVNPKDASLMTELLGSAHSLIPESSRWTLKTDAELEEGSVIVESPSGLIKSLRKDRASLVENVLNQLTMPLSNGDQVAFESITQTLMSQAKKAGLPLVNNGDELESQPDPIPYIPEIVDEAESLPYIPTETHLPQVEAEIVPEPDEEDFTAQTEPEAHEKILPFEEDIEDIPEEVIPFAHAEPEKQSETIADTSQEKEDTVQEAPLHTQAEDIVDSELGEEVLQKEKAKEKSVSAKQLPDDLADQLLAEMGF